MELDFFLNIYAGKANTYGFSLLKVSMDDVYRSFIELTYNTSTKKWGFMIGFVPIV